MNFVLQPWQLLFVILAGWVNRQQQEVIQYLRTENQVLMPRTPDAASANCTKKKKAKSFNTLCRASGAWPFSYFTSMGA